MQKNILVMGLLILAVPVVGSEGSNKVKERISHEAFFSPELDKPMAYSVVLPEGYEASSSDWPVLFLLHGLGRNERTLIDDEDCRALLLQQEYVIILPRGEGGWYINSPVKQKGRYADYLDALMAHVSEAYRISNRAEGCGIAGWSAGAYGSVQACLRRPGDFSALATIIGVLDFPKALDKEGGLSKAMPRVFGDDPQVWDTFNPLNRAGELKDIPVLLVIGDRAFDRSMNEAFAEELEKAGGEVELVHLPGGHTFTTVKQGLPYVLNFMSQQLTQNTPSLRP